jgi:pyruvate dehydrogenase E1 component alpha subunit
MLDTTSWKDSPINDALSDVEKKKMLHQMQRIRRFEQQSLKFYNQGEMGGFLHLYSGQESVAVVAASLMNGHDEMITAYRDHGHALAVGMSMEECMAELFGKATGCSQGKGGSMHFFDPARHYWGGHGIVGGQVPLGIGLAFALKYKEVPGSVLCFCGDGAINQGPVSESWNLASLWQLPIVFVIENNFYSMGTSLERSSSLDKSLAERATGFQLPWKVIDGSEIYPLRGTLHELMEQARHQFQPSVLEVQTYRYYGHSVADANHKKYRSPEEIEEYKTERDPILLWENLLLKEKVITPEEVSQYDKSAKEEAAAAAVFAKESPWPDPSTIFRDVYYEVDHHTESGQQGTHFFSPISF